MRKLTTIFCWLVAAGAVYAVAVGPQPESIGILSTGFTRGYSHAALTGLKTEAATPLPTGTATPTIDNLATVDIAVTTPTVVRDSRIANDPKVNLNSAKFTLTQESNPTLRPCDYYFAQWGRRRARGTEADPFPFNKRVPLRVGCALQTAEVNRVVNGR